ncbi:MAG: rod shape-determining protein RodA [Proteobacteria bacterium]|jgi:rod shape determining protein RodA|nr:rod shape-determining protein RodA [Pseudomonadota bacterium]
MQSATKIGSRHNKPFLKKFSDINWFIVLIIIVIACFGFAMLYSVAGGSFDPWAKNQMIRFVIGLGLMLFIALIDVRVWMFLAYPLYALALGLLGIVEIVGESGKGSQRWLDLGFMNLQPSELIKIALVLALARFFHCLSDEDTLKLKSLVKPLFLIVMPAVLVLRQPDLGTTLLIVAGGIAILFAAGIRMWIFIVSLIAMVPAAIGAWQYLKPYQKKRVLTFLNPEQDPLGAGYHIIQSKIALGSGGIYGKGFIQGTQSQLNFLPEKHTDFIFTVIAEELGLMGGLALLFLYLVLLSYAMVVSISVKSQFGRLLIIGMVVTFFLYLFINIAMVMGLIPVVGVPLPLVSYGGSAMLTLLVGYGFIMSAAIHRDTSIPRGGAFA